MLACLLSEAFPHSVLGVLEEINYFIVCTLRLHVLMNEVHCAIAGVSNSALFSVATLPCGLMLAVNACVCTMQAHSS